MACSIEEAIDGRERVVCREEREPFIEGFADTVELDTFESLEDGGGG